MRWYSCLVAPLRLRIFLGRAGAAGFWGCPKMRWYSCLVAPRQDCFFSAPFRVSQFGAGACQAGGAYSRRGGRVACVCSGGFFWTEGALGPLSLSRLMRILALVPCPPASIDVCLLVWEQFWCDRAGLFCGSWAFHRVRRRLVRRGPSRGKTYAYPEGHPQWLRRRSA